MNENFYIPEELFDKIASSPYDEDCRNFAVRLGICRALADCGLTPDDVSEMAHKKYAAPGSPAKTPSIGGALMEFFAKGSLATTALLSATTGLIGLQAGRAQHKIERRIQNADDPEIAKMRAQMAEMALLKDEVEEGLQAKAIPLNYAPAVTSKLDKGSSGSTPLVDLLGMTPGM